MSIKTVEISRAETAVTGTATKLMEPWQIIVGIDTTHLDCGSSKNVKWNLFTK